ncbi:MAG: hypothetical protein KatS3mg015_2806 [Fimbriimonadales bacterium]|nr:MAG: hypothetical protein KatS3mg015_2806 [Fimbriimonadales bacterium]
MLDSRRPVIPIGVEEDEDYVVVHRNGTFRNAANIILREEDVGRIRAGYVCANCLEAQDAPFPKECWVCKFPMADQQAEYLAKAYRGNVRTGPSSSLEDELAALDELEERERMKGRIVTPQIIVPRLW